MASSKLCLVVSAIVLLGCSLMRIVYTVSSLRDLFVEIDVSAARLVVQRPHGRALQDKEATTPTFQGLPLAFQAGQRPPVSSVHCTGANFNQSSAWEYRSCEFVNLCFDTKQERFVTIRSATESKLQQLLSRSNRNIHEAWQSTVTISTLLSPEHSAVSPSALLGEKVDKKGASWFPLVLDEEEARQRYPDGYYRLPDEDILWIPWQPPLLSPPTDNSLAPRRHWLWTCWWPLYVLASLFPRSNNHPGSHHFWPLVVNDDKSNRDYLSVTQQATLAEFEKHFGQSTAITVQGLPDTTTTSKSALICLRRAAAGMGRLVPILGETDSIGHGPMLQSFSRHFKETLHIQESVLGTNQLPKQDTTTQLWISHKLVDTSILDSIKTAFQPNLHLKTLDFTQQVHALSRASLLFMTLSEECWAPMLLPDDAVLILLYRFEDMKNYVDCVYVLNNISHLQVEWIDLSSTSVSQAMTRIQKVVVETAASDESAQSK